MTVTTAQSYHDAHHRLVRICDWEVARGTQTLVTTGLGSCVGIALHASHSGIGALAHVLLPHPSATTMDAVPAKFASTAVAAMVQRMRELGASGEIRAKLVGGASMFSSLLQPGAVSLGARNVAAAHMSCAASGVAIVAQDVGGAHGRSVYFCVATGDVLVRSIQMGDVFL